MTKAWFHCDPEAGLQRDEFGGTFVYENGKTLADGCPERYFQAPIWTAWILEIVETIHWKVASQICKRWAKP